MTPSRARAARGTRAIGHVPQGHWRTLTLLGALRYSGMAAGATIEVPTDGLIFELFIRDLLLPALHEKDVVIWDNLPAHRTRLLEPVVESVGALVLPLPPYSPDFSPIEPCWSKVKAYLRAVEPRDAQTLGQASGEAFATITAQDAQGWFKKCGYCVH